MCSKAEKRKIGCLDLEKSEKITGGTQKIGKKRGSELRVVCAAKSGGEKNGAGVLKTLRSPDQK